MKNAHPLEVAIVIAVLVIEAAITLARAALVPMIALVLVLARGQAALATAPKAPAPTPAAPEAPLASPALHPLAALADQLIELPVTQLRTLAGTRSKRIRKAELIAMVTAMA